MRNLFKHSIFLLTGNIAKLKHDNEFFKKMSRRKKLPYNYGRTEKQEKKYFQTQIEHNKKLIKEYKEAIKKLQSK